MKCKKKNNHNNFGNLLQIGFHAILMLLSVTLFFLFFLNKGEKESEKIIRVTPLVHELIYINLIFYHLK